MGFKDITVIMFTGEMYSGKTVSADYLMNKYGYAKVSLATPLKNMASNHYCPGLMISKARNYPTYNKSLGIWEETNGRDILVKLGEAIKNNLDYSWFYAEAAAMIKKIYNQNGISKVVIDDCRFEEEYTYLSDIFNVKLIPLQVNLERKLQRAQDRDGIVPTTEQMNSNTENFTWVSKVLHIPKEQGFFDNSKYGIDDLQQYLDNTIKDLK